MVYDLSGDFVRRVDCDELLNTKHVNRVVFYGDDEELAPGGRLEEFYDAAVYGKYSDLVIDDKSIVFYHNDLP